MTSSSAEPLFSTPRYAATATPTPASQRLLVAQDASRAGGLLDQPGPMRLLTPRRECSHTRHKWWPLRSSSSSSA